MANIQILFESPVIVLQLLIDGLLIGAIFTLVAYGMALVWGVMNLINVAQGELVMLGGYMVVVSTQYLGLSPFFGIPLGGLAGLVLGWLIYRLVLHRVVGHDMFISLLATFGVSILLAQLLNQMFGPDEVSIDSGLGAINLFADAISISVVKLVSFGLALATGAAILLFLKRTRLGQAIRATAQNPRAARAMGIDIDRIYALTFAINGAICGVAGALVAMTWVVGPFVGLPYTVRSFMIVILAGLGNMVGVVLAGLGLGLIEHFSSFLFGAETELAVLFSLFVLLLLARSFRLRRQRRVLR
jgi:branched-chain amino acid transport system permease protein